MSETVYIPDEFTAVVAKVNEALTAAAFGKTVFFMYGPPAEIVQRLQKMSEAQSTKDRKYPLIALFTDIVIEKGDLGIYGRANLNLIIATLTQAEYYAEQRYTQNFKPVLHPIYETLMQQLYVHKQFSFKNKDEMQHRAIDRLYWGKQGLYGKEGNIFNDRIDAIEIQDLQTTIRKKICSPHLK